jgi:hypothetical protein
VSLSPSPALTFLPKEEVEFVSGAVGDIRFMSHLSSLCNNNSSSRLRFKNLLVVIKQTAYEEYSQVSFF